MKVISLFILAAVCSISAHAGMIYVPANSTDNAKAGKTSAANVLGQLDAKTFLALTPAKVQQLTGTRLNFGQKVTLKMAQLEVKKQLKKGKTVNMAEMGKKAGGGINFLWLVVGFFLGWIGVLIAYLTREGSDDNRVKSAWIGFGISALLVILFYVLFFVFWANAAVYEY